MRPLVSRAAPAAALAFALAGAAGAQEFRVLLGGQEIGALSFADDGTAQALRARFAGTPLSVADGTFDAESRPATGPDGAVVRQYLGRSDFTTGGRTVSVLTGQGRAVGTTIDPEGDRTALSDPAAVPEGVLDPAQAFGRLARSEGCPAFRLYDGRRVAEVATAPAGEGACSGTYTVTAGPGHLSPLGIQRLTLDLAYEGGTLTGMTVRTGPFELTLAR